MSDALVDRMVRLHMRNGTVPHPPRSTDDHDYAQAYEVVILTLATLRNN